MHGYAGQVLRVDLAHRILTAEPHGEGVLRKFVGGTGLGAKYLYEEVGPEIGWNDSENRILIFTGPLGATPIGGTGTFSIVFKGPMTNLAGATQASGMFGAFLKLSGYDGIAIAGKSSDWTYLYIDDEGEPHLRDANALLGLSTRETELEILRQLGIRRTRASVYSIGPAGEHLVRFACLVGDGGHVAAHNGIGAVFGAKKLKAIVVARGRRKIEIANPTALNEHRVALDEASAGFAGGILDKFGTGGLIHGIHDAGMLPVRNYATNLYPSIDRVCGQHIRTKYEVHPEPCWACRVGHVHTVKITEGTYEGFEGEEPEYECIAACGPQMGITEPDGVIVLSNEIDWLGMDVNESGWLIGWLMECYEKGLISKSELGGIELTWGNVEAVRQIVRLIAYREGIGDWLAEGVMRASRKVGSEAEAIGVYTLKGASPRTHDHRARWTELLDTVCSNTGTIEASFGAPPDIPGMKPLQDPFSPKDVVRVNVETAGYRQFEDCVGICRFCSAAPEALVGAVNCVTGWDMDMQEATQVGQL
jgi:aldehyde:ferredoxin oxidoreductase